MRIGFTGTQRGMTADQRCALRALLNDRDVELFTHGGCVGADDEADEIARKFGVRRLIRPSDKGSKWGKCLQNPRGHVIILPPEKPLVRNLEIIRGSEKIIACPSENHEVLRSGTWMTIRHAKRILGEAYVTIFWP